nr:ribosomal protein L5 [Ochrosphaera neapolitana]
MRKNLHVLYKEQVVPALYKDFGYKNIEEVPKVLKVSINRGLGEDSRNSKELEANLREMATISGQQPIVNKARKSIAGFKIRDGMPVGASVTLRREKMYAFLERLIHITLPRIRDFRGMNAEGFDGRGNYNLGIKDQLIFPEISYDDVTQLQGFDIAIATSAKTDEEAYSLLLRLGMPLKAV